MNFELWIYLYDLVLHSKSMKLSLKHLLSGVAVGLILIFSFLFSFPDGKIHIFFCNVGQGDAAYIRAPSNQDMLIDGGPDTKVLNCLGRHMPFYDRTIDVVMLTHPQKDHLQGLLSVLQRYQVKYIVLGVEENQTDGYQRLVQEIKNRNIPVKHLYTGDKFSLGKVKFEILWPERKWVVENVFPSNSVLSDLGNLSNPNTLGLLTTQRNINDFSIYLHLAFGSFSSLFTGDGDTRIQGEIMKEVSLPRVNILKYPHHGSKYGAGEDFLKLVSPDLTVISVGKNPWGHPTPETLDLLAKLSIPFKRTDQNGDVEIVSDGQGWVVKSEKGSK